MVSKLSASAVAVGSCLGWAGSAAGATGTIALCGGGAGNPLVSPLKSGRCPKGKRAVVLASGGEASAVESQVTSLQSEVGALQSKVASLESSLSSLQNTVGAQTGELDFLRSTFSGVSRSGKLLTFSGMNVEVNSGAGSTDADPNGLGNVIIGYNEDPGTQTGSNNLVLGQRQTFTSYGGIVAGLQNTISAPYASVTGGGENTASGRAASVTGGSINTADGLGASISGGGRNDAAGEVASVTGGLSNRAIGDESTVSGGVMNAATDAAGAILGGCANVTGTAAVSGLPQNCGGQIIVPQVNVVVGGANNRSSGGADAILGGGNNAASALDSALLGGDNNSVHSNCATLPNEGQSC